MKEGALNYINKGFSIVFVDDKKQASSTEVKPFRENPLTSEELTDFLDKKTIRLDYINSKKKAGIKLFRDVHGIAILTGKTNKNLEVIDVDVKYDNIGTLWSNLEALLKDNLPEIYDNFLISKTKSGGYHIYYRCETIQGNIKLANRETTPEEREETYQIEIQKGTNKEEALKISNNDKIRVLIETRGEGGYAVAPPTKGYEFIQGDIDNIPTISKEQREVIFTISKTFNTVEPIKPYKPTIDYQQTKTSPLDPNKKQATQERNMNSKDKYKGITSIDDYEQRGDFISYLISKGWTQQEEDTERVYLLRPGSSDAKHSGNYHKDTKKFICFSTSTEFEPQRPYNISEAFNLLESGGDWKQTALKLGKLGYGDYSPKQAKETNIRVDIINKQSETSTIVKEGGILNKIEIENALGSEVIISAPNDENRIDILEAISLCQMSGKRVYVNIGGEERRDYVYQLNSLFKKYGDIQDDKGFLEDRDKDNLLDEVIIISANLSPIDKEQFLHQFINETSIKEIGISEASLGITIDRLTTTRDKEAQNIELKKLLSKAQDYQKKGQVKEALDLLDKDISNVKLKDNATEFKKLLLPTTEAQVREEEANFPDSLNTGYLIDKDELLLPSGAISVFAAPTNHGKTIMLINTVINVAERYPDKKFIFLTYEERATSILQYFLNTYIDIDLNKGLSNNRRVFKEYFKTGDTSAISVDKIELFKTKKDEFFKQYIETGRIIIKYVDYNSSELGSAIQYLNKEEPNLGGVFIDYFQLLNLPNKQKKNSRQEELKEVCISLKNTSVDTGLPLVLAAQFNREVTNLERLHPTNIGEAGDIERIVNTLIGLWNMDKKPLLKGISESEKDEVNFKLKKKGIRTEGEKNMYLEILKSRDLPTGSYDFLDFNGNTGRVKNRAETIRDKDKIIEVEPF